MTYGKYTYTIVDYSAIPEGVRFTVLPRDQGQAHQTSFGHAGKAEAGPGAKWARTQDCTLPGWPYTYWRRG